MQSATGGPQITEQDMKRMLHAYYKRLFPYALYYKWLCYGDLSKFSRREISFTLYGDIYVRNQAFDTVYDFIGATLKSLPIRVNLGAVYKLSPAVLDSMKLSMRPVEKEVVFDVDINEYDDFRRCCSGKNICSKCWKFMGAAVKILDAALRQDFGYEKLLWVFSGRRGIHCLVADKEARLLDEDIRSAVGDYLQLIKGGQRTKQVELKPGDLHHSIKRALTIIDQYFVDVLQEHDILGSNLSKFVQVVTDESLVADFQPEMDCRQRWEIFRRNYHALKAQDKIGPHLIEEIKLHYLYPRLDIKVTKGFSHLLKSPFCVHPSTGKVCVPFDRKTVDDFDPTAVPTIWDLMDELSLYDALVGPPEGKCDPKEVIKLKHYRHTSLDRFVQIFEQFVSDLE